MHKLKTKLSAEVDGKVVGYYTATTYVEKGVRKVTIYPRPVAGSWTHNLESLLGLDRYSAPTDFLWLDFGQRWGVSNIRALMREIVNMEVDA